MFCISVSFKKTPLEIRQQFAFSEEEQIAFLSYLTKKQFIAGGIIVSTCNRSELYFTGEPLQIEQIENALAECRQIPKEYIKKYCLYYYGRKAVRHLYKVVCGLDSMVLGEDEILRQVKEAYLSADAKGFTDRELNIIFQGAFNCAKLSKSETRLSNTPVSIGTLTANLVAEYLQTYGAVSGNVICSSPDAVENKSVLVIGATGKIGSIVTKNLLAKGISVIATSRRRSIEKNPAVLAHGQMEWLEFDRRYEVLPRVAAIVSATASPHYILTKEPFLAHSEKRKYLLVDLAVPYDLDKELGGLAGISLYDIDYFRALSKENGNIKLGELEKVEHILEECVEEVLKKLYIREFQEKMSDQYEERWFQKMTYYLRDVLDSEQFLAVLDRIYQRETTENSSLKASTKNREVT